MLLLVSKTSLESLLAVKILSIQQIAYEIKLVYKPQHNYTTNNFLKKVLIILIKGI